MRKTGFILAAAILLSFAAGCSSKKRPDVIITYSRGSLCMAPIHVANANGYFAEEFKNAGYTYSFVEVDSGTAPELIAAGKADASATLSASNILPIENGLAITFTAGLHTGCTKYFVRADSPITELTDLRGKKIGLLNMGDSATINIQRILAEAGLKVSGADADIELVFFSASDLPLALENGAIDLAGMHDPTAYIAQKQYGFRTLIDTVSNHKFAHEYCCQSYVTTRLVREKPEAAAAFTRAIMKGAAFVKAHPAEAARIQVENHFVEGDAEQNGIVLGMLNYNPGVAEARQTVANITNELKAIGLLKPSTDTKQFISEHFTILSGVPESYVLNEDGSFTAIW